MGRSWGFVLRRGEDADVRGGWGLDLEGCGKVGGGEVEGLGGCEEVGRGGGWWLGGGRRRRRRRRR